MNERFHDNARRSIKEMVNLMDGFTPNFTLYPAKVPLGTVVLTSIESRKLHKKPKFQLKAPSKKLTALTNKSSKPVGIKHNYEYRKVRIIDGLLCMVFMTYVNYQIIAHVSLAKPNREHKFQAEYLPMESKNN